MKHHTIIVSIFLIAALAACGEQETMFSKCMKKEISNVPATAFVSKFFDAELASKFEANFFVDTIEERKADYRARRDAYRSRGAEDKGWDENIFDHWSKERQNAEEYSFDKRFSKDFLELNFPTVYSKLVQSDWLNAIPKK